MKPSLLLHLLTVSLVINIARSQQNLTLAVFLSGIMEATDDFTGNLDGKSFQAAVKLAVELINNRTDLLPEHRLNYTFTESQCQAGPSVRGFIEQIAQPPTKIMILGADCSTATEPVAELAPFWNLVQISSVSTSPRLSDMGGFGTFLRTVSSDEVVAMGIADLMVMYDWSRSAVISQQEFIFTSTFSALQRALNDLNFDEPREFTFISGDNPEPFVDRLRNSPTRIIFLNTYPSYAREILCQAFHLGMTHSEGYQWLLFGWYPEQWWVNTPPRRENTSQFVCDTQNLETVLESAFAIDHFPHVPPEDFDIETDLGFTRREFDSLYDDYLEQMFPDADRSLVDQVPLVFDSVWTAALALNATQGMNNSGEILFLDDFTYEPESKSIADALYMNALNLNFTGVSGPVSFDNTTGDRSPNLRFFQYQRNSLRQLELVSLGSGRNFLRENVRFPSGVPVDEEFVFISLPLFIVLTILACVGIILSFLCLAINFLFINRKVVKFSSPFLNVPIVVGIIMFFVEVILFGVDENIAPRSTVNALCMVRIWIANLAFSLVFGTILFKTWRVYFVFRHTNRNKKRKSKTSKSLDVQWLPDWMLEDWVLLVMVGILLIIDVIFLIPVTAHPDARLELTNEELSSNDRSLPQIIALCNAEDRAVWLGLLLSYKALLLIIGIFLAFETRKANLPEYIDSKLIGMSVYGILILSLALTAIGILLEEFVDVHYALIGILIILGNTSLLALIFVPKLYSLWKDPQGLRVTTSTNRNSTADTLDSSSKETITLLSQEAEKLRNDLNRLSMSSNAMQALTAKPPHAANGREFTNE